MDVLSLIGIIMAFVAIIGGNYLEGGHLGALANGPAALIVLGGTIGAALLQSPMSAFKRAMQVLIWILFPPRVDLAGGIDRVVNWSLTLARKLAGPGRCGRCRARQLLTQRPAIAGGRRRAGSHPQHPGSGFLHPGKPRYRGGQGIRKHGRLRADHRHHRCGDGLDPCDGQPGRSIATGQRHRRGVRCHDLWCGECQTWCCCRSRPSSRPSRCASRAIAKCCWKGSCRSPKVKTRAPLS